MFALFLALILADSTYILSPIYVKGKRPDIVKKYFPMTYSIDTPEFKPEIDFMAIPGLSPRNYVNLTGVSIRGSGMEEIKVLFEGIPVKNPQNGYFDFSVIPSDMIGRTEVLLTGNSSYYGYNSMAGLINISLPSPSNFLKIGAGPDGYFSASLIEGALIKGKYFTRLGFSFEKTQDVLSIPQIKTRITNAGRENLFSFFRLGSENFDLFLAIDDSKRGVPIIPGGFTTTHDSIRENLIFGKLSYKKLHLDFTKENFVYAPEFRESSTSNTYSIHLKYTPFQFANFTLSREGIKSSSVGTHERSSISASLNFSGLQNFFYPFFSVSSDYWFKSRRLNPSIFMGISSKAGLYVSYSTGYRLPTYNDLYWPSTPYAVGNPDLKPEYLKEYEVGFRREFKFLRIFLTRFWRNYRDLIKWAPGASGKWSPLNLQNVSIYGIDGGINLKFRQYFAKFSFEYLDRIYSPVNLIYYPLNSWNLSFGSGFLYITINHEGERYERLSGPKVLKPFTIVNLGIKIPARANTLEFSITNLTNKYYTLVRGYPAPGREWRVKITTKF